MRGACVVLVHENHPAALVADLVAAAPLEVRGLTEHDRPGTLGGFAACELHGADERVDLRRALEVEPKPLEARQADRERDRGNRKRDEQLPKGVA